MRENPSRGDRKADLTLMPRRRWGWKIGMVLSVAGVVGGHWFWGNSLEKQFNEMAALCRVDPPSAGVPIDISSGTIRESAPVKESVAGKAYWEWSDLPLPVSILQESAPARVESPPTVESEWKAWAEWAADPLPFDETSAPTVDEKEWAEWASEPLVFLDASVPFIPRTNAVEDLLAAARAVDGDSDAWLRWKELPWSSPLSEEGRATARDVLGENRDALRRLETAKTRTTFYWRSSWATMPHWQRHDEFFELRFLHMLVMSAALEAYNDGDHPQALRRIEDLHFLARVRGEYPYLAGLHGYRACLTDAADWAAEFAAVGLDMNGPSETRERVRALISTFLDELTLREVYRQRLREERGRMALAFQSVAAGGMSIGQMRGRHDEHMTLQPAIAYAMKPWILKDGMMVLSHLSAVIDAMDAPDWPAYQRKSLGDEWVKDRGSHWAAHAADPQARWLMEQYFRTVTQRRLAAAALALRCYFADHGRWPERLSALVPRYMPGVPGDPLAAGETLRYVATEDEAQVYSVGLNGIDDGGSEQLIRPLGPGEVRGHDRFGTRDAVVRMRR